MAVAWAQFYIIGAEYLFPSCWFLLSMLTHLATHSFRNFGALTLSARGALNACTKSTLNKLTAAENTTALSMYPFPFMLRFMLLQLLDACTLSVGREAPQLDPAARTLHP